MQFNSSGLFIRDLIYPKILDNTVHELLFSFNSNPLPPFPTTQNLRHCLTNNYDFLYHYHLTNLLGLEVGKHFYKPLRYSNNSSTAVNELASSLSPVYGSDNTETYLVEVLMQSDLNKVNLFFATVAWLTIDDFKWHTTPGFEHIPEDLSYGLVTDYPDMLLPYSAFVANIDRRCNLELLEPESIELVTSAAKDSATP